MIPCFNEAETIGPLVSLVRAHVSTVVVVDDGSGDGTGRCAEGAGARVLRHAMNRGKGTALTTGLREAERLGFGWALLMDGDGQHSPADIPAFWRSAEEESADLVVGNRMEDPAGMPWLRRVVNRWMSDRLGQLAGRKLPDTQCGFRLVRLSAWSGLPVRGTHFEIESEWLLEFLRAGYQVSFVRVRVVYGGERSKIRPLRDTWRWWRWWRGAREGSIRQRPGKTLRD